MHAYLALVSFQDIGAARSNVVVSRMASATSWFKRRVCEAYRLSLPARSKARDDKAGAQLAQTVGIWQ